jgi:hypothetical protein
MVGTLMLRVVEAGRTVALFGLPGSSTTARAGAAERDTELKAWLDGVFA